MTLPLYNPPLGPRTEGPGSYGRPAGGTTPGPEDQGPPVLGPVGGAHRPGTVGGPLLLSLVGLWTLV